LFLKTSKLLHQLGWMNNNLEYPYAIGLIIGGTETQPIHYDVAKSRVNKATYDEVMRHKNPPAGLLFGFGHPVRLAIRQNAVTAIVEKEGEKYCNVDGANATDEFLLVSQETCVHRKKNNTEQTTDIAILEAKHGFCFKGDFNHAGAPLVLTPGEQQHDIWNTAQRILQVPFLKATTKLPSISEDNENQTDYSEYNRLFTKLCGVKSLNTITRLHVQLCPKNVVFKIDSNSVIVYEK